MRLRYLNLLIILVLACGKNSYIPTNKLSIPIVSKSKNEINFDYIETVILKPSMGEFIGYPSGFHANNNQFLIADRTRNKMLVFDSSGKMLYVAGGAGSGPGEFKKLTYSSFGKNFIVGFDGAKYGVNVYDNTGEFLYMINRGMHGIIIQNSYLCIGVGDVLHCNTLPENWAKKSIFLTVANNHNIPLASSFSLKKNVLCQR